MTGIDFGALGNVLKLDTAQLDLIKKFKGGKNPALLETNDILNATETDLATLTPAAKEVVVKAQDTLKANKESAVKLEDQDGKAGIGDKDIEIQAQKENLISNGIPEALIGVRSDGTCGIKKDEIEKNRDALGFKKDATINLNGLDADENGVVSSENWTNFVAKHSDQFDASGKAAEVAAKFAFPDGNAKADANTFTITVTGDKEGSTLNFTAKYDGSDTITVEGKDSLDSNKSINIGTYKISDCLDKKTGQFSMEEFNKKVGKDIQEKYGNKYSMTTTDNNKNSQATALNGKKSDAAKEKWKNTLAIIQQLIAIWAKLVSSGAMAGPAGAMKDPTA